MCVWKMVCQRWWVASCVCEQLCVSKIVCPRGKGLWKIPWEVNLWCVCDVRKWGVGSGPVLSELWNRGCNELVWWGSDEWEVSGEWDVLSGGWAVGMVSGKWLVTCDEWWVWGGIERQVAPATRQQGWPWAAQLPYFTHNRHYSRHSTFGKHDTERFGPLTL